MTDNGRPDPFCEAEVRVVGFDGPDLACRMTVTSLDRGLLGTCDFRVAMDASDQMPNIIVGLLGDAGMNPMSAPRFEDGAYTVSVFDVSTLRR